MPEGNLGVAHLYPAPDLARFLAAYFDYGALETALQTARNRDQREMVFLFSQALDERAVIRRPGQ